MGWLEAAVDLDYKCPEECLIHPQWLMGGFESMSKRIQNIQVHCKGLILQQQDARAEKC